MFKELNTLNIDKFYFDKSVMAFILMHNFIEFLETIWTNIDVTDVHKLCGRKKVQ